jgi:spermidine/putrescine transport system ATP-binding protein
MSDLSRGELLQAGAGAALGAYGLASLAGCGIGRGIRGDVDRVIEPKADGDLYYFNYSQYINPALVKEFEERHDVRVIQSYFDSMEGMLAKLRAGNAYDVMFPTAEYVQRLVQQEQLLRIPRHRPGHCVAEHLRPTRGEERAHRRRGGMIDGGGEAIRFEGVTKRFGPTLAVDDLSLSIRRGEFFSLLGPSGCGKTTTLRMVAGFEQPTEGSVHLEGVPVDDVPPYERNVNTVFQSYALFEHLDVEGNVAFGLKRRRVAADEIRRRVAEALELVQLTGRERAKPRELSGGQMQRVALARALVNRPGLLLLDEPLGALDLKLRKQMQVELKQIQREVGITFLYVTHDQEEALSMSDQIAVMHSGRVIQCGAPEDVYEHPQEEFVAGFIGISNLIAGRVTDGRQVLIANGVRVPAPLPEDVGPGDEVNLSIRPEKIAIDEEVEDGMVAMDGTIEARVYLGVMTQITVGLGDGARLVALEQAWHRARAEDRWEPGMAVRIGWSPENSLVLR